MSSKLFALLAIHSARLGQLMARKGCPRSANGPAGMTTLASNLRDDFAVDQKFLSKAGVPIHFKPLMGPRSNHRRRTKHKSKTRRQEDMYHD